MKLRLISWSLALLLAGAASLPAQEEKPKLYVPSDGTQAFRQILHELKLTPKTDTGLNALDPKRTIIIALGGWPQKDLNRGLRRFIDAGGAVLIATSFNEVLRDFGVRVTGLEVEDFATGFHGHKQCPVIPPQKFPDDPLFQGVTRSLATNCPSLLALADLDAEALLEFPGHCRLAGFDREVPHLLYGARSRRRDGAAGRYLVLAGDGIFRNGMMLRPDTGNLRFAINCIRWLSESDAGQRTHALLFENGEPVTTFKGPLAIPMKQISEADIINALLDKLETEDGINRLFGLIPRQWLWRGIVIMLTGFLLFWTRRRLHWARHNLDTRLPLVDIAVEKMINDLPALSRRHRDMVKNDNYLELAQSLARDFLECTLGIERGASELPAVEVEGNWWQRRRLHREIRHLWELAHGNLHAAYTGRQLRRLLETLPNLSALTAARMVIFSSRQATHHATPDGARDTMKAKPA